MLCIQPDQNVTATLLYPPSYLILSHSSSWRSYFCKNIGDFWIFCVLVIKSCVIWSICGLTNKLWRIKTSKISIM